MLLAIDPGRDTGWAIYNDAGVLRDCGLGDPRSSWVFHPEHMAAPVNLVIIERPQIYQGRSSRVDPNDLITLAIQVGRYTGHFEDILKIPVEHVLPRQWKGSLDADVCTRRIEASLSPVERSVWESASSTIPEAKKHNVLDAIGLGRWSFKRARAGVF